MATDGIILLNTTNVQYVKMLSKKTCAEREHDTGLGLANLVGLKRPPSCAERVYLDKCVLVSLYVIK